MLQVQLTPHRSQLRAGGGGQKLFVLLKVRPDPEAALSRPRIHIAIVVDTSGSMHHKVTLPDGSRQSKLAVAMEAARRLVDNPILRSDDRLSIIQFDAEARLIAHGAIGPDRAALLGAVDALGDHSGITRMSAGLREAATQLERATEPARKVLLLTDGQTLEPGECLEAASKLAMLHVPIIAIGLGSTYNEILLRDLSNLTLGRPLDLPDPALLGTIFEREIGGLTRQVLREVELHLRLPYDAKLVALTRVYPSIAEIDIAHDALMLGQIEAGDDTIFVLEIDAPDRAAMRMRIAQVFVQYQIAATGALGRTDGQDLIVTYTDDDTAATVNDEVLGYVQQRNTDQFVRQATELARTHPEQAAQYLQQARMITQRFGNTGMTIALTRAEGELQTHGMFSPGTLKTINLGVRTQTVRLDSQAGDGTGIPSTEEIRRLTGT